MGASDNSISKVSTLLAERRKYESWLAALDQRRATTPEHVFTRVRADYQARLEAVVAEMANDADALDTRVQELTERAASLEADVRAVQDERAEAELRAHVGELEAGAWETVSREAEERLRKLEADRRSLEDELASIRELVTAARTPTPAASSQAVEPASGATAPAAAHAPDVRAAAGDEGKENAPVAATPAPEPDAPAPQEHVEGAAGGDAPLVSTAEAGGEGTGNFDELAFLRDITGAAPADAASPVTPPADPAPKQKAPERPVDDTLGLVLPNDAPAIAPIRRASVEVPMAANVASNTPIIIKPEAGRQGKTLKCTECGSMNYPTEWYCERCGAELSAL